MGQFMKVQLMATMRKDWWKRWLKGTGNVASAKHNHAKETTIFFLSTKDNTNNPPPVTPEEMTVRAGYWWSQHNTNRV